MVNIGSSPLANVSTNGTAFGGKFVFSFAGVTRTVNADWFNSLGTNSTLEFAAKTALRQVGCSADAACHFSCIHIQPCPVPMLFTQAT